jgi:hypothetical protein
MLVWSRSLLALVALWLMAAGANAELRVLIVSSDSSAAYADATKVLTDSLELAGVARADIRTMSVTDWTAASGKATALNPQAFVALGTEAAASLARDRLRFPVLSALLPAAVLSACCAKPDAGRLPNSMRFTSTSRCSVSWR